MTALRPQFVWPDRRPIGILHLAGTDHRTPSNPRGWIWDGEISKGLDWYFGRAIAVLKEMGAQAAVLWDVCGLEHYDTAGYIGAPDLLPTLAPDMAPLARRFTARFQAEGIEIGSLIRHQELDVATKTQNWNPPSACQVLLRKARWAHRYLGARYFYIDSNGQPDKPIPAIVFAQLHKAMPDSLFIPEHGDEIYSLWTARYREVRGKPPFGAFTSTPQSVRSIIPKAFSCINVSEGMEGHEDALREAFKSGDIAMRNAWWRDDGVEGFVELMRSTI